MSPLEHKILEFIESQKDQSYSKSNLLHFCENLIKEAKQEAYQDIKDDAPDWAE